MRMFIILMVMFMGQVKADVGKVVKIVGGEDAYLLRENEKISLTPDAPLQKNDEVFSGSGHVVLQIFPSSQLSLSKGSQIRISGNLIAENEKLIKAESIIDLLKGLVRLQVVKQDEVELEQKIQTQGVAFSVRGTDFEVSLLESGVEMDVYEGEVEVTSPHVHTFVPYYVTGNDGFQYSRKQPAFAKKKFSPRLKEAHFIERDTVRENWRHKKIRMKELRTPEAKKRGQSSSGLKQGMKRSELKKRMRRTREQRRPNKKPGNQ